MTKTSRLVVVCALGVLALRCSTNDSGLGVKYDAAPGGARDAAADRPAQTGGAITTGGALATGGTVASGGVTGTGGATNTGGTTGMGTGGRPGAGGTTSTSGRTGTGGTTGAGGRPGTGGTTGTGGRPGTGGTTGIGGRPGTGGTMGTGGTQGKDAGPGCSSPDAGSGCCYTDEHCGNGQECVGGACNTTSQPGVCKPTAGLAAGQCWRNSDCPSATPTCQGVGICGCDLECFVADTPGTCAK